MLITVVAIVAATMVTTAVPAFAGEGGVPSDNAYHGQNWNKAIKQGQARFSGYPTCNPKE